MTATAWQDPRAKDQFFFSDARNFHIDSRFPVSCSLLLSSQDVTPPEEN